MIKKCKVPREVKNQEKRRETVKQKIKKEENGYSHKATKFMKEETRRD